ncbi:MAG: DUF721 domain-containing protein [Bacteroides sp.]|nr:DUF721 domain-containing protein [Bacteroides sp.]
MKKKYPEQIGNIVERMLEQNGVTNLYDEQRLCYLWAETVGPGINRRTTRRFVEDGVLHVYLTSAVLKNELTFRRRELVEALNKAVGKDVIHDVVFH